MNNTNAIPNGVNPVISLAADVLGGAQSVGAAVGLEQNTAEKIAIDFHDLVGDPATPLIPGKQARYAAQKTVVKQAYATARATVKLGRERCQLAVDILKPVLGSQWNNQWNLAGFTSPSLEVPVDPVPMLLSLRAYFAANPAREVPALNITAAEMLARMESIQAANLLVGQARQARVDRKVDRDASLKTLKARLSGTRSELDQLLSDDDGRWYDFGFRRPVDGKIPAPVSDLILTPGAAGQMLVAWSPSAYAANYRVRWSVVGSSGDPIEAGLVTDPQIALTGLPSGATIRIAVTASNAAGETAPTEAQVVVP